VIWDPPRRPQGNGAVERSQGTAVNRAEPGRCRSPAELQRRLDEEDRVQREAYPHAGAPSRPAAYPGLAHSGRRFGAARERAHWSWGRVLARPGGYAVPRRVDGGGEVGLYGGELYVGTANRGPAGGRAARRGGVGVVDRRPVGRRAVPPTAHPIRRGDPAPPAEVRARAGADGIGASRAEHRLAISRGT
jgi:hypothetical protein